MELNSLHELYVDELKDLYSAENQLLKALPRMAKAASHPQLKRAFQQHERQTQEHVRRLERIFKSLGERPGGKKCHGMEGLIDEGKELIQERPHPDVLDAGLISKAQHIEHYEMAGYGTVRTYARLLGREDEARVLQQTLDDEGEADKLLTNLAVTGINLEADRAEENDEADSRPRKRGAAKKRAPRKASGSARKNAAKKSARKSAAKKRGGRKTTRSR
jgi:ferritin-like metal-binding protein YciE